jgi:hypothetical protein
VNRLQVCINSTQGATIALVAHFFPTNQADLIRSARGGRSQAEFARALGVDRSCLSRYEREVLGAPPSVINHCLAEISRLAGQRGAEPPSFDSALSSARELVRVLEQIGSVKPAGASRQHVS